MFSKKMLKMISIYNYRIFNSNIFKIFKEDPNEN